MAIILNPAKDAGILYVNVRVPPDPEFVVSTTVPPTPRVPNFPMVTLNISFGGRLLVLIVTDLSCTTVSIENVGYPEYARFCEFNLAAETGNTIKNNAIK